MKTEKFTLASTTDVVTFDTLVKVIRFDEGNAGGLPVMIRVKSLSGGVYDVEMKPGRQITLPEVTRGIVISNLSGAPVTGKITIGAGDVQDNSIIGEVQVVDGGKARSLAGTAYGAYVSVGAVAAQYSSVQIWNPAGSGKAIYLEHATITLGIAGSVYAGIHNTQLPTAFGGALSSKKTGGPASVGVGYRRNNAVNLTVDQVNMSVTLGASAPYNWELREPLVIMPNSGFTVHLDAVNGFIQTNVQYFEEAL